MRIIILLSLMAAVLLTGCRQDYQHQLVNKVDLEKFMGDWYVIAVMPNPIEKNIVNGIESYELKEDGKIDITYSFYKENPEGKKKVMHPKAFVYNQETNAEWRVKFFPLVKYPYLIIWLDEEYQTTAIGVPNRKYAWIMSREPQIEAEKYDKILARMEGLDYQIDELIKIPQIWE